MHDLPAPVRIALARLEHAGYEAYLVGGAVRDFVRDGSRAKDYDITTSATPDEVESVFSDCHLIETGLRHGTVTVLLDGEPLEITTFRVDGGYSDHRHPDAVRFTASLREDVARRDFTMNALAWSPTRGVVDLVGGQADLACGLVRCVGDPDRRFREDALRILRALRFASVYEMRIEDATAAAIHRNRALLCDVASERVRDELTKLLCGTGVAEIARRFADVLAVVVPEIAPMFGFEQHNPHHDRDVWEHTLAVVASIPPEPVLRWAALLHDIGKPACFAIGADGFGHFYAHAAKSAETAEDILRRLRFENAARERIVRLVRYHDMPITAERTLVRRLVSKHGEEAARQLIALHRADACGQSALCAPRLAVFDAAAAMVDEILQETDTCFTLRSLAVNGHDLMALGLRGREIGHALQYCLDAVLDDRVPNEREALLTLVRGGECARFSH